MSITREQVKALQALEREATKGPWAYMTDATFSGQIRSSNNFEHITDTPDLDDRTDDMLLIAEARNALPALITTWLSMADKLARVEAVIAPHEEKKSVIGHISRKVRTALVGERK